MWNNGFLHLFLLIHIIFLYPTISRSMENNFSRPAEEDQIPEQSGLDQTDEMRKTQAGDTELDNKAPGNTEISDTKTSTRNPSALDQAGSGDGVVDEEEQKLAEEIENPNLEDAQGEENLKDAFLEPFIYDGRSRRDPFFSYTIKEFSGAATEIPGQSSKKVEISPIQKFDVSEFRLTTILWSNTVPKAMVRDPANNLYVIKKNDLIGKGYVHEVREGEVIVIESKEEEGKTLYTTQILRMPE